ncbi:hypothetical protein ACFP2T_16620 [Plantactinospora solaniradicis]|uniref:Uncharacterized protein n=1 Tax=Plantactinospora solaniradicis TaxID=1723736 RepID=A0ABW1K979_9ACTN
MQPRTVRAIQRLALCAGFCAAAWVAAEGLDHGTAFADDVPVRIEQEQPRERPGGPLDELLDDVLPGRGNDRGGDDPRPPDDTDEEAPERPADPTPEPDPRPEPEQTEEPERPRGPIEEVIEDIVDEVTPEPVGGDDGSPQHPVDPPPAPDTEPTPEPEPELPTTPVVDTPVTDDPPVEQPVAPTTEIEGPPFGGDMVPTPWTSDLNTPDFQTGPRTGGSVCDSRDDRDRAVSSGASTRDQADVPRHLPGPRSGVPINPCDPDTGHNAYEEMPATLPNCGGDPALAGPAVLTRVWVLDYRRPAAMHDRHNDALPPGRLTLWPPSPG